jgi:hypothetical protein
MKRSLEVIQYPIPSDKFFRGLSTIIKNFLEGCQYSSAPSHNFTGGLPIIAETFSKGCHIILPKGNLHATLLQ